MFNQALIILSAIFAQIQWLVAKLSGARYDHVTELDTYVNDFFSKYRNNGADDKVSIGTRSRFSPIHNTKCKVCSGRRKARGVCTEHRAIL